LLPSRVIGSQASVACQALLSLFQYVPLLLSRRLTATLSTPEPLPGSSAVATMLGKPCGR